MVCAPHSASARTLGYEQGGPHWSRAHPCEFLPDPKPPLPHACERDRPGVRER
ncbi:MAG TPA: hypothetical protein VLY86_03385 [Methanothrix sp.]|nr:hypothetical protein [Methanothrix sp.]